MRKLLVLAGILVAGVFIFAQVNRRDIDFKSPGGRFETREKALDKYTIERLGQTSFSSSNIELGKVLAEEANFTSYIFYFWVDFSPGGASKKVSGLANIPKNVQSSPAVILFRGYVDREKYTTGTGSQRVGEALASAGFITLAPDFLGYGESDMPSVSPIEERFQTYMTALTLLKSVDNLNKALEAQGESVRVAVDKIGIWGHSNGGQIALTILEITGESIPTVLWAPVSKPFPYSVLYFTDDFSDRGKMLRRVIADFERDYDVERYSLTNYFDRINNDVPIQLHQGLTDQSVPYWWSDQLNEELTKLGRKLEYFRYQSSDHNLAPAGWQTAVDRSINFYRNQFSGTIKGE